MSIVNCIGPYEVLPDGTIIKNNNAKSQDEMPENMRIQLPKMPAMTGFTIDIPKRNILGRIVSYETKDVAEVAYQMECEKAEQKLKAQRAAYRQQAKERLARIRAAYYKQQVKKICHSIAQGIRGVFSRQRD